MVNDQEPRYRLVDSNGNVVGSLFQNADGNVEIQDETGTGSVFGPNGIVTPAIDASSVEAESLGIEGLFTTVQDGESIQSAVDRADENDYSAVLVPQGNYNESVDLPRSISLYGLTYGQNSPTIDATGMDGEPPAIESAQEGIISGFEIEADNIGIKLSFENTVRDCEMRGDIVCDNSNGRVFSNRLRGNDIVINGDNWAVFGNTDVGAIDDQGTGNDTTGGNT